MSNRKRKIDKKNFLQSRKLEIGDRENYAAPLKKYSTQEQQLFSYFEKFLIFVVRPKDNKNCTHLNFKNPFFSEFL